MSGIGGEEGRIMALDLGRRRIGVAMTDDAGITAHILTTIKAESAADALKKILELVREHGPVLLVVGLPINMDGSMGPEAERCRKIADEISLRSGVPVAMWDERLTTSMAERSLMEQGMRRKKRKEVIDQVAAVFLLQDYLQHSRSNT